MKRRMGNATVLALLIGSGSAAGAADLRIDTRTADGRLVTGADCIAANEAGVLKFISGRAQPLRSSFNELLLVCTSPGQDAAIGALRPITGLGYPSWIEMVFGEVMMFDMKRGAPSNVPVKGTPPGKAPQPRGVPTSPTSHECMQRLPGAVCE
jgi:hypothetical protein